MKFEYLGNLIGGSSYFGMCRRCGSQHVSTHDRVVVDAKFGGFMCAKCGSKAGAK
jgi:hypothetical protein